MEERYTSENLLESLENVVKERNLEGKVLVTVTDNATNIVRAVKLSNCLGQHIPYFAYTLLLSINKSLSDGRVEQIIKKCGAVVSHFHHSTKNHKTTNSVFTNALEFSILYDRKTFRTENCGFYLCIGR